MKNNEEIEFEQAYEYRSMNKAYENEANYLVENGKISVDNKYTKISINIPTSSMHSFKNFNIDTKESGLFKSNDSSFNYFNSNSKTQKPLYNADSCKENIILECLSTHGLKSESENIFESETLAETSVLEGINSIYLSSDEFENISNKLRSDLNQHITTENRYI